MNTGSAPATLFTITAPAIARIMVYRALRPSNRGSLASANAAAVTNAVNNPSVRQRPFRTNHKWLETNSSTAAAERLHRHTSSAVHAPASITGSRSAHADG